MRFPTDRFLTDPTHRTLAGGAAGAIAIFAITFAIEWLSPPLGADAMPPLIPVEAPAVALQVDHARALDRLFDRIGFTPTKSARAAPVPPLLLRSLPRGFGEENDDTLRKRRFIRVLLPIVLRVNRIVARQRVVVERLAQRSRRGAALSAREWRWLGAVANFYRTQPNNWRVLFLRVAPIPPSLVIAQAAAESGWGTSRFAREGNALFGVWTMAADGGLKPRRRDEGKTHHIKTYDRLIDSVWDYARNLNTHRAYRDLRQRRAAGVASGVQLAAELDTYSEKGVKYVALIRQIMAENDLARLDGLSLARRPPPGF